MMANDIKEYMVCPPSVPPEDLPAVLAGMAIGIGVGSEVVEHLEKAMPEQWQPPERWMHELLTRWETEWTKLTDLCAENVDRFIYYGLTGDRLAKAGPSYPYLTPAEMRVLADLVRRHFTVAISGVGEWSQGLAREIVRSWEKAGIVQPSSHFDELIRDAFTAGRISRILKDAHSYAEMLALAKQAPFSRANELAAGMAKEHAAQFLTGYGDKFANEMTQMGNTLNHRRVRDVIARYAAGELREAPELDGKPLLPEEYNAVESERYIKNWHELAGDLRQRMQTADPERDWRRVAVSETRAASNVGRLMGFQEEGTGYVYFLVQLNACDGCKRLYLELDKRTPRLFPLRFLLDNIHDTDGFNVGLKQSLIGQPGGWIPNALVHPWCRCRPQAWHAGLPAITPAGTFMLKTA